METELETKTHGGQNEKAYANPLVIPEKKNKPEKKSIYMCNDIKYNCHN